MPKLINHSVSYSEWYNRLIAEISEWTEEELCSLCRDDADLSIKREAMEIRKKKREQPTRDLLSV